MQRILVAAVDIENIQWDLLTGRDVVRMMKPPHPTASKAREVFNIFDDLSFFIKPVIFTSQ